MEAEKLNALLMDYIKQKNEMAKDLFVDFNILELTVSENSHTRVLMQLLKYENLTVEFLNKFIPDGNLNIQKPEIRIFADFIDGQIVEEDYCVIIENKVNNAVDQEKQIERYIKTALAKLQDKRKVFVIYLTRDGRKEAYEGSLTPTAKEFLDYKDDIDSGRFITMNYRYDVLPWLKDYVLPNCKAEDDIFISGVKQYIDYLEGMFGLREREKKMREITAEKIEEMFDISTKTTAEKFKVLNSKISDLEKFKNDIEAYIQNKTLGLDDLIKLSLEYFKEGNRDENNKFVYKRGGNFLYFAKEKWENKGIHFEWFPFENKNIVDKSWTLNLHVETKDDGTTKERLKEKIAQKGFEVTANKKASGSAIWMKECALNKAFVDMSEGEKKEFIKNAYKEIEPLGRIIDEFLK
jgi:hypothetical protein